VACVDPTPPSERTSRPQRLFYRHLVASLAGEVAILVVAAATRSVAAWAWTALFAICLTLAAHTAVVFVPSPPEVTPPENRRTPWE
jgi:hypothetical protein